LIASALYCVLALPYITVMGHRKRARMQLDEVLTDLFAGLVIAALIAGAVAQLHT
jgi:hypothetical protein